MEKDKLKSKLFKIASALALGTGVPCPYDIVGSLPKSTSRKTREKIFNALNKADLAMKNRSIELDNVIREL